MADIAAGHYASTAILACLSRRLVTGHGEYVDISLYDSIVSWLTYLSSYYFATGKQPPRMGSAHPSIVPYQSFSCKDTELIVAVGNDVQWQGLCHALDLEYLSQKKEFGANPQRVRNRRQLIPILSKRFRRQKASFWYRLLNQNGVPAAPIYGIADVVKDAQIKHRGLFRRSKSGITVLTSPIRLMKRESRIGSPAPRLGKDTRRVLRGLGYPEARIVRLARE